MTQSAATLHRKIKGADDLRSVVKNLKTMAAVSIGPYEKAVLALQEYSHTVELGLAACLRQLGAPASAGHSTQGPEDTGAIVFGSDQGMVGRFNDHLSGFLLQTLASLPGQQTVWPVGERLYAQLLGSKVQLQPPDHVPELVGGITPLIGRLLLQVEQRREKGQIDAILLFHNRPMPQSGYEPICQRLLPLDTAWMHALQEKRWPTRLTPEVRRDPEETFAALLREYLFVSMFRACAESLASENAARLAAMQGAEENIETLLERLNLEINQERQSAIDAELFEIVSGFEALATKSKIQAL